MTMSREDARYCAFYCEENAWHLCQDERLPAAERYVLWITNPGRRVALFDQRLAPPGEPVVWDYHVVVVTGEGPDAEVWDLDSRRDFPSPVADYLDLVFPPVPAEFAPVFRLVPVDVFVRTFASDRRHMKKPGGGWLHEPPPWPLIGEGHVLDAYLDLSRAKPGEIMTLPELRSRFG